MSAKVIKFSIQLDIFLWAAYYVGYRYKKNPIKICLIFLWSSSQILQNIKHVKCTLCNGSFE